MKKFHRYISGGGIDDILSEYENYLKKIQIKHNELKNKGDAELKSLSEDLRKRSIEGESPDDLLIESYALCIGTIKRILKLNPFDVQIIGAIAIHQGKLAQMQTGEGKTLSAVFPAYLNALSGEGVHILTFNDYLARRDAEWMRPVYEFLGLTVGYIQEKMPIRDRQSAYNCDVTYITAKEAGFDYLRDGLCYSRDNIVHRKFIYAIIDEADSIMIDEARIPLIIAEASDDSVSGSYFMANFVKNLEQNIDFAFDEYQRNIHYTDEGIRKIETSLGCVNLFAEENIEKLLLLNNAIHAEYFLRCDVDYIVRKGKVELIDEFTGRVVDKRRWPDGLQAALEAKENINIQTKGKILNSITIQHFIQIYAKISGMTATAFTSEKEFLEFYNIQLVIIPPNRPCIRKDNNDIIFKTRKEKTENLISEITGAYSKGRPVLVGTRSVKESSEIANALLQRGFQCEVLNAKRDEYEAKIIAQAGMPGSITISTNMAGRGTDIKLGGLDEKFREEVIKLGGLLVIGTNRHESQRIDNQLRGRAGRQGDPGTSTFFISLDDDLFFKYGLKELFPRSFRIAEEEGIITNQKIYKEINRVQRIIEGENLEIKKTVYKYSSLIDKQRKIIYQKRLKILDKKDVNDFFQINAGNQFELIMKKVGIEQLTEICMQISLSMIDCNWSHYLAEINDIREGIHFRRLGGQDPVYEFHKLVVELFDNLDGIINEERLNIFKKIIITDAGISLDNTGYKAPSSTWTYLINDNSFEEMIGLQFINNMGLQVWAGFYGPLLALLDWVKKKAVKKQNLRKNLFK